MTSNALLVVAAAAISVPILGLGVYPVIESAIVPKPESTERTPFCDRPEGAPGELNGQAATVWRLCDAPFLFVVPATRILIPEGEEDGLEPQFYSPTVRPVAQPDPEERP